MAASARPRAHRLTAAGLRRAAADLFTRPALWFVLAGVFGARALLFAAAVRDRPDTRGLWIASRDLLRNPRAVYEPSAAFIASHHGLLPPPDGPGYLGTAPNLLLGLPLAWLPEKPFVLAWTALDAVLVALAVWLLLRHLRPSRLAVAVAALVTVAFPPVFAELAAGQRGGPLLLLGVAAMLLAAARPAWAGAAAGVAASLKVYPAALVLGAPRAAFVAGLAVAFAAVTLVAFAPLGGPGYYAQHVLVPALSPSDADCAIDSVRSLWMRAVGGERYAWASPGGLAYVRSPIQLPLLATLLTYLTDAVLVVAATVTARRVGFGTPGALAVTFALGALIPGEVYPYQFLPLLPLALLVAVGAVETRRWQVLAVLGVACLGFVRPPCDTPLPNLWTLSGLAVFAVGVWQYRELNGHQSAGGGVDGAE